jgi:hypothetical protein
MATPSSRRWLGELDWSLIILVVAFFSVLLTSGAGRGLVPWLFAELRPLSFQQYESAIREAAIKSPASSLPLTRLDQDAPDTEVVKFGFVPTVDGKQVKGSVLKLPIFVALPAEVKARCSGAADPQAVMQRVLGLPPSSRPKQVTSMKFATRDIFRPCVSTDSTAATSCTASVPDDVAGLPPVQRAHFEFSAGLLMQSYRIGFSKAAPPRNDYPDDGFPFTGMGYSWDWGSQTGGHFGVSEFVVDKGATIEDISNVDLGSYCAAAPPG